MKIIFVGLRRGKGNPGVIRGFQDDGKYFVCYPQNYEKYGIDPEPIKQDIQRQREKLDHIRRCGI